MSESNLHIKIQFNHPTHRYISQNVCPLISNPIYTRHLHISLADTMSFTAPLKTRSSKGKRRQTLKRNRSRVSSVRRPTSSTTVSPIRRSTITHGALARWASTLSHWTQWTRTTPQPAKELISHLIHHYTQPYYKEVFQVET